MACDGEDDDAAVVAEDVVPDECAAAIDGGVDDVSPLQWWDAVMKKYGVMQQAEAAVAAAERQGAQASARAGLDADHAKAVAAAVEALAGLTNKETRKKLEEFQRLIDGEGTVIRVGHGTQTLSSFSPNFWGHCFVDLFFRVSLA